MKLIVIFFALSILTACTSNDKEAGQQEAQQSELTDAPQVKQLTAAIEKNPRNSELYVARAQVYHQLQNIDKAKEDLYKAIEIDSTTKDAYHLLSGIFFNQNRPEQAVAILEQNIAHNPDDIDATLRIAEIYFYLQNHKAAIDYVNKALKKDVFHPRGYFLKGLIYKDSGDTARAISNFQTAVEQDPDHYAAYMQLGLLSAVKGNNDAIDYFNNALRINPESTEALYAKGMFYQQWGQFEEAKKTYRQLMATDPQNEQSVYNIGYIYFQQDSLEKAHRHFDLATKVDPAYVEAYYMRGLTLERMGDLAEAKRDYNRSLSINPNYELALKGLERIKAQS